MHYSARRLAALLLPMALVGCKPDDPVEPEPTPVPTGTLKVVIKPTWNGAPFQMNAVYQNVSDYRVKVEVIKFYLGNVQLVNGSGSTTARSVEYFDLAHNGDTVSWSGVRTGTWNALHAGFGVPQTLNDADPIHYPSGHPLDLAKGTYWSWEMGYRFLQFDGRYDVDGAGTGAPASPFSMHTGFNACYQEFDLGLGSDLVITAGATTTLVLDVAVDRFFYTATDTVDLATENQTHGSNLPLALELTNCAAHSFSVE